MFNTGTVWTECGIQFTAVHAEHSDNHAIGMIIYAENKTYYITGDTLYNHKIWEQLPESIDYLFLPVNGVGNNMNFCDAARFSEKTNAKQVIPLHFGLFDNLNPMEFQCENRIIPEMYKKIINPED